jgi:hypothetical protein
LPQTDVFGDGVDPSEISVFGSDTIVLDYPYCVRDGDSVSSCKGMSLGENGVLNYDFDVGFKLASTPSWSNNQTAELGCFYITGPSAFAPPTDGWVIGLKYKDTPNGYASMVKGVCAGLIPFESPAKDYNRISSQVRSPLVVWA